MFSNYLCISRSLLTWIIGSLLYLKIQKIDENGKYSSSIVLIKYFVCYRGLDSLSSLQCARVLKQLAYGGRTVVCTIHQPSAHILELFDQVHWIKEGVRTRVPNSCKSLTTYKMIFYCEI